jgi:S-formylglutathione hydrolase FrmB
MTIRRSAVTCIATFAVLALLSPAAASAWPDCDARTAPIKTGIHEVDRSRDGRLLTLDLASRAMGDVENVNVLLPHGYGPGSGHHPVLYLLHGAVGSYSDWIEHGAAEIAGGLDAIIVMPDGGSDGGYSDWTAAAAGTPEPFPAYESYYMDELIPFVDSTFRTKLGPANRAIAGLSMGGHGAIKLAAEYPGKFGFAGSFSGAVNPSLPLYQSLIQDCKWGDPAIDEVVWRDNDPTETPANLRGIGLFIRSGDGSPGPHDPGGSGTDIVESVVKMMNDAFLAALDGAGVRDVDVAFGPGTHTWPYWQDDLAEFVDWLRPRLGTKVSPPHRLEIASAHDDVGAWGWDLATHRRAREFLYVGGTGKRRLELTGSGRVDVTSPRRFRPRADYRVRIGKARRTIAADRRGRLSFPVRLGPSHTVQQTEFGADAIAGWREAAIRIRRAP